MARQPLVVRSLTADEQTTLEELYHRTRDARLRTRAQMILLATEQQLVASEIAVLVRQCEQTVRNWIKRFNAEGLEGLKDQPRPGSPVKVTDEYRERPRARGAAASSRARPAIFALVAAAAGRLHGRRDGDSALIRGRALDLEGARDRAVASPAQDHQSRSRVRGQKKAVETQRATLKEGEVFYYADAFNISWHPTLKAMWSPKGQQVMIPAPGQPTKRYGIGAVNYHSGETVMLIRRHKRRKQIAELLEALLEKHRTETIYVAWDNATTHFDDEVEAVIRGAAGRLVLLYLPTYSPWLNPIEMLWRHYRREVTHGELFISIKALVEASEDFFRRYNEIPEKVLSIIGAKPQISA